MKFYQWEEKLRVGIDELDDQHKDIFKAAQEMNDAMSHGKGREKCYSLYKYLATYTEDHFSLEEKYIDMYEYENGEAMKRDHDDFRKRFKKFQKQFDEQGPSVNLVVKSMAWITEWLTNHILTKDIEFAKFLKRELQKEKGR